MPEPEAEPAADSAEGRKDFVAEEKNETYNFTLSKQTSKLQSK